VFNRELKIESGQVVTKDYWYQKKSVQSVVKKQLLHIAICNKKFLPFVFQ
jgi:hypothetical protein